MKKIPNSSRRLSEHILRALNKIRKPSGRRVFRPAWNESSAHQRQFTGGFFRILADDCYLSEGDVVTRAPVFFPRDGTEVFSMICFLRDSLQRPHMKEIMADRMSGSHVLPKVVVGGRNNLSSDLRLDSPRIQQILGNILAVLVLLRPFPQRNRTPIFLF